MCKNTIQFQKGLGIMEFLTNYGSEEQCEAALFSWRWPDGFQCPRCGSRSFCNLHRKAEFQCNRCHHQTSLTSGTIFDSRLSVMVCPVSRALKMQDARTLAQAAGCPVGNRLKSSRYLRTVAEEIPSHTD